ncbi:MAG: AMP-binding protein [Ignavibacteria bacterium]|nr:AMP-binding protein [Ignavibacteria bacterium]
MKIYKSCYKLGEVLPNIAAMLRQNAGLFADKMLIQEKVNGSYRSLTWKQFYNDVANIAFNLRGFGFSEGDKLVIFSKNRIEMLQLELAVMASGGISVPIFFNYNKEIAESLIAQSGSVFIAAGDEKQLSKLSPDLDVKQFFVFDDVKDRRFNNLSHYSELLKESPDKEDALKFDALPDEICLNMFTSGTMGSQKCVQLTHRNILSQQAAVKELLGVNENDRFLSYLRWHHSFGGIFEVFTALYNGASITLESSNGLNPSEMMENWKQIKPTVFFSVPLIFHSLHDLVTENKDLAPDFFHDELKLVFTAAAPLPKYISDEFENRNIPVLEGWGLTETSPCCTLTDRKLERVPGVVGFPIPGVDIGIADDGEIVVKGPNVMRGYYNNEESNKKCFTDDGWFCTGDIGEMTKQGLKLITRKDRIFKLTNAEKVIPTELENMITGKCHFISHVLVEGSGKNYATALLFPDKLVLHESMNGNAVKIKDCVCPQSMGDLSSCLKECLNEMNCNLKQKFAKIKVAMLIDDTLKVENRTLTPSMKLAPNSVKEVYKAHIDRMYNEGNVPEEYLDKDVYLIYIEE